jgi:hypothetical protein
LRLVLRLCPGDPSISSGRLFVSYRVTDGRHRSIGARGLISVTRVYVIDTNLRARFYGVSQASLLKRVDDRPGAQDNCGRWMKVAR